MQNADMINVLQLGLAGKTYVKGNSVLLHNRATASYLISSSSADDARFLLGRLRRNTGCVVTHRGFERALAAERFGLEEKVPCRQFVYTGGLMPAPAHTVKPLDKSHLATVRSHYTRISSKAYILARLNAGELFGLYEDGELAAFGGLHSDGVMGMLEVFPPYRRRGLGRQLTAYVVNDRLARGLIPLAQVVEDNLPSLAMQRKLGFEEAAESICWMYR